MLSVLGFEGCASWYFGRLALPFLLPSPLGLPFLACKGWGMSSTLCICMPCHGPHGAANQVFWWQTDVYK